MTTIAFDGTTIAADTLAVDAYGLKNELTKIRAGNGFVLGIAGEYGHFLRWWKQAESMDLFDLISFGYPEYARDTNDPAILIGSKQGIYRHASGMFIPVSRKIHACGSGRDYALAAMYLGKTAREAVQVAMHFDNGTGGDIHELRIS